MFFYAPFFVLGAVLAGAAPPADPELEKEVDSAIDPAIDPAIDLGVEFLLRAVAGPGGWTPEEKYPSGYAALTVYALVKSDVSYAHPLVQKGIAAMEEYQFQKVYSVALYVMAYDAMLEQIEVDRKLGGRAAAGERARFLERMDAGLDWLLAARLRGVGAWNYEPPRRQADPRTHRYDNSNTQFAVLALGVGAERKLRVPVEVWEEIADHFIRTQEIRGEEIDARVVFRSPARPARPGSTTAQKPPPLYQGEGIQVQARGWRYYQEDFDRPRFSMTCAGLSSLLLARRNLAAASQAPGAREQSLSRALRDGYGWATRHLSRSKPLGDMFDPFYDLYSLEKVGDLGEVVAFGDFHWYREGARRLLRTQRRDGSWLSFGRDGEEKANVRHSTALALLFLARATDLSARERPLARITFTGGRSPAGPDAGGRTDWLYLPSQKAEVPLGRLFRLYRYRATKEVIRMVEEAVKVQDPERIHELVPPLCAALERSPFPTVQVQAKKLLVQATGADYAEAKRYQEWARRWAEVMRIGKEGEKGAVERLREWLASSDGTPLKAKVIWALERVGGRAAIGDLVELLTASDAALRDAAHRGLTFLSGQSLPFEVHAGEKVRAAQVRAWRDWLAREGPIQ